MKINYDQKMEAIIASCGENKPNLLLHSCCAPCSSATLERLAEHFKITILFYNPNIAPEEEFDKRELELERLLKEMPLGQEITVVKDYYDGQEFLNAIKGLEHTGERGERCYECYKLRLERTAAVAKEQKFDYFTTTLSISPHKNAQWLNEIGEMLAEEYGVDYLYSDFKKKNGYKRSIELSQQYQLYRQDYCGCAFSKAEREAEKLAKDN